MLLRDIEPRLIAKPLPPEDVLEVFTGMERATALAERVTACTLGIAHPSQGGWKRQPLVRAIPAWRRTEALTPDSRQVEYEIPFRSL